MDASGQQRTITELTAAKQRKSYASQMITGAQIRAARALLGWTSQHLAAQSGINYATISRAEQFEGVPSVRAPTLAALQSALERGGVVFLAEGDMRPGGPGVRLR